MIGAQDKKNKPETNLRSSLQPESQIFGKNQCGSIPPQMTSIFGGKIFPINSLNSGHIKNGQNSLLNN